MLRSDWNEELKEVEFEANVSAELGYKISNLVRVFGIEL